MQAPPSGPVFLPIGTVDMSNRMPSLTALLGLLALAGYQNREKISELFKNATASASQPSTGASHPPGLGGLLGNLSGMLGGAGAGGLLSGGLEELFERFKQNGMVIIATIRATTVRTSARRAAPGQQMVMPEITDRLHKMVGANRQRLSHRRGTSIMPERSPGDLAVFDGRKFFGTGCSQRQR
jgi:hypothetical protein